MRTPQSVLCAVALASCAAPAPQPRRFDLESARKQGVTVVESFFGAPFERAFEVKQFAHRAEMDADFAKRWGMPKTECWMVAAGVADGLYVLAPEVWGAEACEHDPDDVQAADDVIAHELVHVFHGQRNPTGDFTGMDDVGWFVEGLAVYASGQYEHAFRARAAEAVAAGAVPKDLASAWSGKYRYATSASLVAFVDRRCGREKLFDMLRLTQQDELLAAIGLDEAAFLAQWRESVTTAATAP